MYRLKKRLFLFTQRWPKLNHWLVVSNKSQVHPMYICCLHKTLDSPKQGGNFQKLVLERDEASCFPGKVLARHTNEGKRISTH